MHSPKCSGNRPIDKAAAVRMMTGLLGWEGKLAEQRLEFVAPLAVPLVAGKELRIRVGDGLLPENIAEREVLVAPACPARFGVFDV